MQVVINTKIGGFDVSAEALYELIMQNCKHISSYEFISEYPYEEWISFENGFEKELNTNRLKKDNIIFFYNDNYNESRTNNCLIQTILKLGKNANTQFSELKIIEIPDEVKWYIRVYDDGTEEIYEKHRIWG